MMNRFICIIASLLLTLVFTSEHALAQAIFEPDSVVQISQLEKVDSLLHYDGNPYTGEAFFINKDTQSPMVMRSYVAGTQEGLWRTWHSNGRLYKEGSVKAGKEDGRYLEYHESGILRYEYFYDLGKKTGRWRSWYESGSIYTERNFKDGQLHGRLVHYDEDGVALVTEDYEKGRIIATTRTKKPRTGAPALGKGK